MKILSQTDVTAALGWTALIDQLQAVFRDGCTQPLRTVHSVAVPGEPDASLLMMPAWQEGGKIAIKLAVISPGNAARGLPAVNASVITFDAVTGAPLALIEGGSLTARRTAATSALAARYLAREDAKVLLVVGNGTIAANLIEAHKAVRDYADVLVWGRNPDKARAFAEARGATAVTDLDAAVARADTIACATMANDPLIRGALLKPGTHLDFVGGFLPDMREGDDDCARRAAGKIFMDTSAGVLAEAGDLLHPLETGAITRADLAGELADLCRGSATGRESADQITYFKSVGAAIEDFAAAAMI